MATDEQTRERKTTWWGLLGGAALVVLVGQLFLLRIGGSQARASYDLPFRWFSHRVPEDLVMVYVDPQIKTRLGQSTDQPLDRRFYARLLERLTGDGARLVLFDILFDSPAESNDDAEFAEAIRKHGNVVLVGDYAREWQGNIVTSKPLPPIAIFTNAAAGWGLANVPIDPDNEVRSLGTGIEDFPSVTWVAASRLGAETTRPPGSRSIERWVNYYCGPSALRAVNLDHALETNGLAAGFFRNRIVVVGSRSEGGIAGAGRDEFQTPYSFSLREGSNLQEPLAPGASIHAFMLLNLIRGDWMTRLSSAQQSALAVIWGILISFVLLRLRPWTATLVAPVAFCAFAIVAIYAQARFHVWFAWLVPAGVQTSVALIWSVGFQYLVVSRRRRKLRRAFAAYLSPHMADRIAESGFDLSPGGQEVEATIMFTDLEGFTRMSETLPPSEVSRILISYLNETTRAILDRNGTIIKYMGDAVMAVWGAPLVDPRPAQNAVLAALGMRQAGNKDITGRRFRTRFGINSGLVLAGNLGSEFRFDYTLIGETTNLASRLEQLNKQLGTDILISDSTRRELDGEIMVRNLGEFVLAGTTRAMRIYEVLGMTAEFQSPPPWLDAFARALGHFTKREFDEAEKSFRAVLEQRGGQDGPSDFYLNQIVRIRVLPADSAWDGSIRMESK